MTEDHKNQTRVARRDDFNAEPMPDRHETFTLNRSFSDEEMAALRRGHFPKEMEDKWFWYMEGSTLWAHRSWTGFCIYRIDFKDDNRHILTINCDPKQCKCGCLEEEIETINLLLDRWARTPYDRYSE